LSAECGPRTEKKKTVIVQVARNETSEQTIVSSSQSSDDPLTTKSHANLNNPVSPDHPVFPWPSKAICYQLSCIPYADISFQHFITALLFSSPRLLFSEAQKKAILSWAKELGARDVPLLYALNCSQETIQKLVSDPTENVTTHLANIFYFNNVGKVVAKVCVILHSYAPLSY
jgi:hypothetical protein